MVLDRSRTNDGAAGVITGRGGQPVFLWAKKEREELKCTRCYRSLFLQTFEPVTDEGTNNEDDDKDDDSDEDTDASRQPDTKAKESGSKQKRDEPEDNPKDDPDDCPGLEEPPEIFFPFPEEPECDTNNENQ